MPRRSQHVLGGVWQAVQRAVQRATRLSSCRLGLKESIQHCVESSGQFARTRPPALPCGRIERGPAGNAEHASLRKQGDSAYWCAHPKQGRALMTPFAGTYSSGNALNNQEFAHIVMGSRSRRSGAHRGSRPAAGGFDAAHRRHDGIECDGRRAQGVRRAQNCDPYSALAARR